MKSRVGKKGVLIPKELLDGADEVEIRKQNNLVLVVPTATADPLLDLGSHPVDCGVDDGSVNHDLYAVGSHS